MADERYADTDVHIYLLGLIKVGFRIGGRRQINRLYGDHARSRGTEIG